MILVFTSFPHFEGNVATLSADQCSHGNGALLIIHLFILLVASKQTLPLGELIEDHMAREPYTPHFFSPFCSVRSERRDSLPSSNMTWQRYIHNQTSVQLFFSLWRERCDSVSWSKITWQRNLTHDTSVHLFLLNSKETSWLRQLMENQMRKEFYS